MTAIEALATTTLVRPDNSAVPAKLEAAMRVASTGAWKACEVVLAGSALRAHTDAARDPRVRDGIAALLGLVGEVALRGEALAELRSARDTGALDGRLDLAAVAASCGRAGDSPVIAAHRRRVRGLAVAALRKELADRRALCDALGDSAVATLLVDSARSLYRYAVRDDRELARWATAPTGTTSRDRALSAFAELVGAQQAIEELDQIIAALVRGPVEDSPSPSPSPTPVPMPTPTPTPTPTPIPLPIPATPDPDPAQEIPAPPASTLPPAQTSSADAASAKSARPFLTASIIVVFLAAALVVYLLR